MKNINNILENRIVSFEKHLSKNEQYGGRNNVEIYRVSNKFPNQDLEENIIKIWKDSDINMSHIDIKRCHRHSLRNTTST